MPPLKVCRIINAMWTGGVQHRLVQLLPRLKARGCEPEVVCVKGRGELAKLLEKQHGIKVRMVRVRGRAGIAGVLSLAWHLRSRGVHVVHTHMYQANVPGTIAGWIARTPCIVSQAHNVDPFTKPRQARMEARLMPLRDRFVCVSEEVRRDCAQRMEVPADRFDVIVNGIDTDVPDPMRLRDAVRAEFGFGPAEIVIAHVARLHPQKNHAGFLRVFPRVLAAAPNCRLLVIGKGDERPRLEALARELGLGEAVRFLGNRYDVPDLLAASDMTILPSLKEGFSNVVLEAMLHETALVVTDVGGAREQLRDGVEGFVVPLGDMSAFADRVADLARDSALRARFAQAAAARVEEFTLDRMADRTMALYESVLRPKGKWPL